MKLKIERNHLTFKLLPSEKKILSAATDKVSETIHFPNQSSLTYSLVISKNETASISYQENEIQFLLPQMHCCALEKPSKEGITFQFATLLISIEVDLYHGKKHACG